MDQAKMKSYLTIVVVSLFVVIGYDLVKSKYNESKTSNPSATV